MNRIRELAGAAPIALMCSTCSADSLSITEVELGESTWVRLLFDGPNPPKTRHFLTSRKRGFGIGSGIISFA